MAILPNSLHPSLHQQLETAVVDGDVPLIQRLLAQGAVINPRSDQAEPLSVALSSTVTTRAEVIDALLEGGAKVTRHHLFLAMRREAREPFRRLLAHFVPQGDDGAYLARAAHSVEADDFFVAEMVASDLTFPCDPIAFFGHIRPIDHSRFNRWCHLQAAHAAGLDAQRLEEALPVSLPRGGAPRPSRM